MFEFISRRGTCFLRETGASTAACVGEGGVYGMKVCRNGSCNISLLALMQPFSLLLLWPKIFRRNSTCIVFIKSSRGPISLRHLLLLTLLLSYPSRLVHTRYCFAFYSTYVTSLMPSISSYKCLNIQRKVLK